ncbi:hypothetical protein ABZ504_43400, partial [Streptomyces mirabilis]|uniref:hypothetical protein n=1 Tax=Streptomyces mirabilis TaxID=68239 RepID=UPI0034055CA7
PSDQDQVQTKITERVTFDPPSEGQNSGVAETCTATCINLLTAPHGSSGSSMIQLERDGMDVIWLSLHPSRITITDIEVLDGRDLGPSAQRSG